MLHILVVPVIGPFGKPAQPRLFSFEPHPYLMPRSKKMCGMFLPRPTRNGTPRRYWTLSRVESARDRVMVSFFGWFGLSR